MEAGVVARLIGAPLSVVTGGIGCLVAVALIAMKARSLLNYQGAAETREETGRSGAAT
jgi:hypothetical protein